MIKEYIGTHEDCGPEDVLRSLDGKISRQTFYRALKELKQDNEVISEAKNERNQKLHLNRESPLSIISSNLEKFDSTYFEVFDTIVADLHKPIPPDYDPTITLRINDLMNEMRRLQDNTAYWLWDMSFMLPPKINNSEYMARIHSFVVIKVLEMYRKLSVKLSTINPDYLSKFEEFKKAFITDEPEEFLFKLM